MLVLRKLQEHALLTIPLTCFPDFVFGLGCDSCLSKGKRKEQEKAVLSGNRKIRLDGYVQKWSGNNGIYRLRQPCTGIHKESEGERGGGEEGR